MSLIIPVGSEKYQSLNFTHDSKSLTMVIRWNTVCSFWNIDLYDNIEQDWLVKSEALALNALTCAHLNMSFGFVLVDDSDSGSPNIEKLGSDVNIYIVDKERYYAATTQSL